MTQNTSMIAAYFERTGKAHDVLQLGDMGRPEPGPNQVLVRIAVSAVNPHDTKKRAGWLNRPMPADRVIPHSDGSGVIVSVGPGVDNARIEERVWIVRADSARPGGGAAAQYAVVPSAHAYRLPDNASFEVGACLGVPGMTAHRALFADGPVTGQSVLITGGAGAVASYAIQFARWNGARVIATVSTEKKAIHARQMGADETVDYNKENVAERVLELTEGAGVDRIVEVDFGANIEDCFRAIRRNGIIAAYSSTRAPRPELPYYEFASRGVTLHFIQGMLLTQPMRTAAARDIGALLHRDALQHPIAASMPLEKIADAHEMLEAGKSIGKVLVASP